MYTSTEIRPVNSLTYADVVGLPCGISRMQGEDSVAFLKRCYQAARRLRSHSYEGAQDELCLQLGLSQRRAVTIASTDPGLRITARIGLVTVITGAGMVTNIPTVTMAPDTYWVWRKISDVVRDLNAVSGVSAVLAGGDGPALQIANQTNLFLVVSEPMLEIDQFLTHSNVLSSSLTFSAACGPYSFDPSTGQVTFAYNPPQGLTATYQYIALPYELVASEVGLFGLVEPSLSTVGVGPGNVPAYQLREAVQAVMAADPCYWAE